MPGLVVWQGGEAVSRGSIRRVLNSQREQPDGGARIRPRTLLRQKFSGPMAGRPVHLMGVRDGSPDPRLVSAHRNRLGQIAGRVRNLAVGRCAVLALVRRRGRPARPSHALVFDTCFVRLPCRLDAGADPVGRAGAVACIRHVRCGGSGPDRPCPANQAASSLAGLRRNPWLPPLRLGAKPLA